ncbi:mitogen-activated kinase 4-like isoform X2 [Xyrichtys novacula]|uniref:Mitogen-activated kinase 4-like isoform X2 n=1 Tax=Xyrichtys novacula TaxID=13765 RepID=A0AAV1F1Z4_XYRNO|nr:mitogen-activated kinase 4-like isoform X2 [Xyrichtys novacula]
MSDAMERMKKKRRAVRSSVSKLLARMEEETNKGENERDYDSLREMLSLLTIKEGQLTEQDRGIEEKTVTEELDSELESSQEYQDRIISWKTRASILIQRSPGAREEYEAPQTLVRSSTKGNPVDGLSLSRDRASSRLGVAGDR